MMMRGMPMLHGMPVPLLLTRFMPPEWWASLREMRCYWTTRKMSVVCHGIYQGGKTQSEERKKAIESAKQDEIRQLFIDLWALQPVLKQEMAGTKPYNCHLLSVKKFLADGTHDKFKSRMVLNGDEQRMQSFFQTNPPLLWLSTPL